MAAPERTLFRGSLLNKARSDGALLERMGEGIAPPAADEPTVDESSVVDLMSPALLKVKSVFKTKICGDLFSSAPKSYEGLMYKSRVITSQESAEEVDALDYEDDYDQMEQWCAARVWSRESN